MPMLANASDAALEQDQQLSSIALDGEQSHSSYGNDHYRLSDLAPIPFGLKGKQPKLHDDDEGDAEYIPLISQRFISFAQHDPEQKDPHYLLAFEFVSPLIPSLMVGYRVDGTRAVDWSLHASPHSHRLSAWKESNLQYRFSQSRL